LPKQSEALSGGDATGQKQGSRRDRGEPGAGVELVAERARKYGGEGAKEQARTFDPGMEPLRGGAVAGEGKAVSSDRSRQGEEVEGCGGLESIDPWVGETGLRGAEQRGTRRSRTQCSVRCMPVVSKAGNRITWNHFFFGGHFPPSTQPEPKFQPAVAG